jgi:hypothetical protein
MHQAANCNGLLLDTARRLEIDRRRASGKLPQESPQSVRRAEVKTAFGCDPFVAALAAAAGGPGDVEHQGCEAREGSLDIGIGVRRRVRCNNAERADSRHQ